MSSFLCAHTTFFKCGSIPFLMWSQGKHKKKKKREKKDKKKTNREL
jgi:hypothetical protein